MAFSTVLQKINQSFHATFFTTPKPFRYVALGDSSVEGIGASAPHKSYTGIIYETLKNAKKEVAYHNLGKDGAKIHDVIRKQLDEAIRLQPDLITISIGANDISRMTPTLRFKRDLDILFKRLSLETNATIVMNTIPDLSVTPRVPKHLKAISRILIKRLNRVIDLYAKEYDIVLVDMFEQIATYAKIYPEIVSGDGYHPSDLGYAVWANTILSEINHIVFQKQDLHYSYSYNK